jgi:hypothetical protein
MYYLPDRLIEGNAAGEIISSVARTPTGEIAGHDALVVLDPATRLYENAAGAVLPAFRGQGLFFRLFQHSIVDAAKRFSVEGIFGEPVCNHVHLQKMSLQLGFIESGLEVDLMPAAAYAGEPGAPGRVSALLGLFRHDPGRQTVHMPLAYGDELGYLYAAFKADRTFVYSKMELPGAESSQGRLTIFDMAQVARIAIDRIGADFDAFLARMEGDASGKGSEVFQVWVPLSSPFVSSATDILRRHGYFIGGVVPCWINGDALLLQKVSQEPNWRGISLHSERAKRIAEIVKRDWGRVMGKKAG